MNSIVDFFTVSWLQALGFTLLHSLWQALIIGAIVLMLLRYTNTRYSNLRYAIATGGLLLIVCVSIATFSVYFFSDFSTQTALHTTDTTGQHNYSQLEEKSNTFNIAALAVKIEASIRESISFFLMVWLAGALMFLARIGAGLYIVDKLRAEAVYLDNEWSIRIQEITRQLNVKRLVKLAESSAVQAPIILGFLKPVILIPIGMCASLSTAQVEAIFLHEIMHIRRKDYLINILQSIVEAIYFFNPSVWVISRLIKQEREHCCDDAVVTRHGNPIAYARALASLEEARLSKPVLALSFVENKNQLLNRIKRLMEKSAKNYSSMEKVLPVLLLIVGLICASWMSTQTGGSAEPSLNGGELVVSDTTKKTKKNRKASTAKTPAGNKATAVPQTNNKNEDEIKEETALTQGFPPVPPLYIIIPDLPPIPDMEVMMDDFHVPALAWRNEKEWEEFGKEFERDFSAKFEEFYKQHGDDIHKLIEDVNEKVNNESNEDWETQIQEFASKQEEWAKDHAEKWEQQALRIAAHHEQNAREHAERAEQHVREFEKNHERFERQQKAFEEKNKQFEKALHDELIRDGYLDENEQLQNMHWHNGKLEINGEKIKPEHEEKYNQLHKKYFTEIHPLEEKDDDH